jgi:hypothetical protein
MSASVPWDALQAAASEERAQAVLDLANAVADLTARLSVAEDLLKSLDFERCARAEIERHVQALGVEDALDALRWARTEAET